MVACQERKVIVFGVAKEEVLAIDAEDGDWRIRFYYLMDGDLYRQTLLSPDDKCMGPKETVLVLREIQEEGAAKHAGARALAQKVVRAGFYWQTLKEDAENMVKRCEI